MRFDRAEERFEQAKTDYLSVPPPKPILAELGFLHQEIELDFLAGQFGQKSRWSAGLDKLQDRFLPLLSSHPDAVHLNHLESLLKTFHIDMECAITPTMLSGTLPRLYEDQLGIAVS